MLHVRELRASLNPWSNCSMPQGLQLVTVVRSLVTAYWTQLHGIVCFLSVLSLKKAYICLDDVLPFLLVLRLQARTV